MEILFTLGLFLVGFAIYFLPSIIGIKKDHNHIAVLIVLNVILPASIIGWFILLIWANNDVELPL
jgi:hypothetical protein